jgi:triosephosphate isomerase
MSARTPIIVGNWKMNLSLDEAVTLAGAIVTSAPAGVEVGVAPSAPYLGAISQAVQGSRVGLAGQEMHWETQGAFTGESSPAQLTDVGCRYVIIGHSERRQLFGETDEGVAKKARAAHDHQLTPILCIGETLSERESGQTLQVVTRQLDMALSALSPSEVANSVIAYEPVWAIGTGKTATPTQAQEVHRALRERISTLVSQEVANSVRLQYGGSVKPSNVADLMSQEDIDGALVGGASLKADSFIALLNSAL